jgi:hypothetical protein
MPLFDRSFPPLRKRSYIDLNGIIVYMDPAVFKEGLYMEKLVDSLVQCPANG